MISPYKGPVVLTLKAQSDGIVLNVQPMWGIVVWIKLYLLLMRKIASVKLRHRYPT